MKKLDELIAEQEKIISDANNKIKNYRSIVNEYVVAELIEIPNHPKEMSEYWEHAKKTLITDTIGKSKTGIYEATQYLLNGEKYKIYTRKNIYKTTKASEEDVAKFIGIYAERKGFTEGAYLEPLYTEQVWKIISKPIFKHKDGCLYLLCKVVNVDTGKIYTSGQIELMVKNELNEWADIISNNDWRTIEDLQERNNFKTAMLHEKISVITQNLTDLKNELERIINVYSV